MPDVFLNPAELGLGSSVTTIVFALLVVLLSLVLAILLAFVTYALGDLVARPLAGPAPVFTLPQSKRQNRA